MFHKTIENGIRTGELSSTLNSGAVARALIISAIGLSVTMKTRPERSLVDNAVTEILTLLE
ncbi:hypothetical protein D3C85_1902950 [compost metagenome]